VDRTTKNIFYVAGAQFVNAVLPFLTIPYIARVLGVEQNGIYSYSYTIVNVLVAVFAFGFSVHGANIIAQTQGVERTVKYLEIQIIRMIFLLIGYFTFIAFLLIYPANKEFQFILWVQSTLILISFFDVSWYYQGIGDFKKIVTRNIIVKLVGNLSVFFLVKQPEDTWIYIILINGSQVLGNIILFAGTFGLFRYVKQIQWINIFNHVKIGFFLFLPNIAVMIYTNFDKIYLGNLGDITGLANYQHAQRIILFIFTFLVIPSSVIVQRIATMRSRSETIEANRIIENGLNFYFIVGIFFIVGTVLCSSDFVDLFLGHEYVQVSILFVIMSPMLLFKTVGSVIGSWYLVPLGRNKKHSFPMIIGTIVSIGLNILLTPIYGVVMATFIAVGTELVVLLIQFYYSRELLRQIQVKYVLQFSIITVIAFIATKVSLDLVTIEQLRSALLRFTITATTFSLLTLLLCLYFSKVRGFIKTKLILIRGKKLVVKSHSKSAG